MARSVGFGTILRKNFKQVLNPDPKEYEILGRKLVCPICRHTHFRFHKPTIDKPGGGRAYNSFVCVECGHVLWFDPK